MADSSARTRRAGSPGADWLAVAEARDAVLGAVSRLPAERRPLLDSLGYVLAENVRSPLDLPRWDNSAMDGFAVRAADVAGASDTTPRVLRVVGDVAAGEMPSRPLAAGEAIRIMTGAPVPEGADCVVRVEHTDGGSGIGTAGASVRIHSDADAGRNIRPRAEDLRTGELVLPAGTVLRAAEIGVAASLGRGSLEVVRRPRVAILGSGDELVDLDGFAEVLAGRRIVSSNSYSLAAQLREIGAAVCNLGIAADDLQSIRRHLDAARGCDVLITTAGVSVGEHDHTREALRQLGAEIAFWRVRMRPGSPFAFGRVAGLGGIPWFGLPGNPVSSMVTFEVLARPALLRMAGHSAVFHRTERASLRESVSAAPGLTHFFRARLHREPDGTHVASLTGAQGSGVLTSMAAADALLVVPETSAAGSTSADSDRLTALVLGGAPLQPEPGY